MRGRIATSAVGASLSLHAALALLVVLRRAPAPVVPIRGTIEVTTYVVPPAPPLVRVAIRPTAAPRTAAIRSVRPASPVATEPRAPAPPPSAPSSAPSAPPSAVDLFAHEALRRAAGEAPAPVDPGGHLRRAGDPAPPADDARETVAARTREWLADAAARERAASGNVAPRWRDLERHLQQEFHPPLAVVKQESVGKALAHQVLRAWLDGPPATGTVARGVDASNDVMLGTPTGWNIRDTPAQQAAAVQSRWSAPATSLSVEVEVTLAADGTVRSARVTRPSGRRAFDRTALAAVKAAIARDGAPDEGCEVVTRWTVDAAVSVQPPTSIGFRFDESGHLDPNAHGWRRYLAPTLPMQEDVHTHVALVAIEPRR